MSFAFCKAQNQFQRNYSPVSMMTKLKTWMSILKCSKWDKAVVRQVHLSILMPAPHITVPVQVPVTSLPTHLHDNVPRKQDLIAKGREFLTTMWETKLDFLTQELSTLAHYWLLRPTWSKLVGGRSLFLCVNKYTFQINKYFILKIEKKFKTFLLAMG